MKENNFTILRELPKEKRGGRIFRMVWARCKCGHEKKMFRDNILHKASEYCRKCCTRTHGLSGSKFIRAWYSIKRRCNYKNNREYRLYGGRGIKCEWKSPQAFMEDMYESYLAHVDKHGEKETTIDRIDVNGNYSKENCRWATWDEQRENKRNRLKITYRGETKTLKDWEKIIGIKYSVLKQRLHAGWSAEDILTKPIRSAKS